MPHADELYVFEPDELLIISNALKAMASDAEYKMAAFPPFHQMTEKEVYEFAAFEKTSKMAKAINKKIESVL